MTDNARIVREALEHIHGIGSTSAMLSYEEGLHRAIKIAGKSLPALTALETELSTTKAELARAREGLKPYLRHLGTCGESRWPASKCTCGLSAALAPEQKAQPNKENP